MRISLATKVNTDNLWFIYTAKLERSLEPTTSRTDTSLKYFCKKIVNLLIELPIDDQKHDDCD